MSPKAVLGIDPGVNGGLALLAPAGAVAGLWPLRPDMTRQELKAVLGAAVGALLAHQDGGACFMEQVGYKRGDGGQGAFTFGRIAGMLEMGIECLGGKIYLISPIMWQTGMECLSGGNKNVTKRRAQELFFGERITHAVADALLIAEFGRRRLALSGPSA